MQTQQEVYHQVVSLYDNRKDNVAFADSIITLFMSSAADYYDKTPHDDLVTWIFNNSVNVSDGEAAYPKKELEIYWREIEMAVEQMRAKL